MALPLLGVHNFTVLKVKAHNAAGSRSSAAPALRWATAGNNAADATAGAARGQEWALLRDLADAMALHAKLAYEEMMAFAKYLVELNVQEVRLKEVIRLQDAEDEAATLVLLVGIQVADSWAPSEEWASMVSACPPPCLHGLP